METNKKPAAGAAAEGEAGAAPAAAEGGEEKQGAAAPAKKAAEPEPSSFTGGCPCCRSCCRWGGTGNCCTMGLTRSTQTDLIHFAMLPEHVCVPTSIFARLVTPACCPLHHLPALQLTTPPAWRPVSASSWPSPLASALSPSGLPHLVRGSCRPMCQVSQILLRLLQ